VSSVQQYSPNPDEPLRVGLNTRHVARSNAAVYGLNGTCGVVGDTVLVYLNADPWHGDSGASCTVLPACARTSAQQKSKSYLDGDDMDRCTRLAFLGVLLVVWLTAFAVWLPLSVSTKVR
jgi:hypothetical protein